MVPYTNQIECITMCHNVFIGSQMDVCLKNGVICVDVVSHGKPNTFDPTWGGSRVDSSISGWDKPLFE